MVKLWSVTEIGCLLLYLAHAFVSFTHKRNNNKFETCNSCNHRFGAKDGATPLRDRWQLGSRATGAPTDPGRWWRSRAGTIFRGLF